MTITRTFISEPAPSGHVQAPPTHAHSNAPRADAGVWAAARRSYVQGCSTPVVAERHGLNERTVRRRAAAEDWAALRNARLADAALLAGEPQDGDAEVERLPELEPFVAAHSLEVGELLLHPQPERLARFAFRRAAECAARGAAAEAMGWMRLVGAVDRAHARLERASRPFAEADYIRAAYAAELRRASEREPADVEDRDGEAEA